MEVLDARCAGLDVHKKTIVACLLTPGPHRQTTKLVRTFGTLTADLLALADWLRAAGCTHVAMESTGVYWKPIWNVLEGSFTLLLVNAQQMKAVPGRKTDVKDAEWIAQLLQHGLLTGSFVPEQAQRELRELTRYRTSVVRERADEVNRLQKVLEGANIKLASVATDIMGVSGRAMLEALVAGTTESAVLADLARGRMRKKVPELEQALVGRFGPHQRFLVAQQLAHSDGLDATIEQVSAEIAKRLLPYEAELRRLQTIPGVGRRTAEIIIAELGVNLARVPTPRHLASWAGLCPGNQESAGKRYTGKTRKGDPWLREALVEAALCASRTKETYLAAKSRRLATRRGKKTAAVAVAHTLLVVVYHLLSRGQDYVDLGSTYFDERDRQAVQRQLVRRLEALGRKRDS
jgi:transposase